VSLALSFMVGAKVANVGVPLLLKTLVDNLTPQPDAATASTAPVDPAAPADPNSSLDPTAPAVTENPSLTQEPAPGALDPSANPPPAPLATAEVNPPAPVAPEPVPVSGEVTQYKVTRGDTLMKIAFEAYGDLYRWKEILDGNTGKIKSAGSLSPGMVLTLSSAGSVTIERNGEKYLIKQGDTLGLISNDVYGTKAKWKRLWENNRQLIKDPNKIYAGFSLYYVPETRMTSTPDQALPFKGQSPAPEVAAGPSDAARDPGSKK
jgi:nucleoid-associated protein YgaU